VLGLVGSALMAVSLLPVALALGVYEAGVWVLGALAALSLSLSLRNSVWAFVPASFWLLLGVPTMLEIATWQQPGEWRPPLLIAWVPAYALGGLCVILGSVRRGRARPQTDVSAFE